MSNQVTITTAKLRDVCPGFRVAFDDFEQALANHDDEAADLAWIRASKAAVAYRRRIVVLPR